MNNPKEFPLVSIVTPSYNQGRFIEETILSVKNQDYSNIEHIIMDGDSTDNTLEILKRYESTYNMRWVSEPDKGQADAVNKGLAMAQGEIIGWLNSDDLYLYKDTITLIASAFREMRDVDVLYGHAIKINPQGLILRAKFAPSFDYKLLQRWCFVTQPSVFFRSRVISQEKLSTDLHYSMDYEFWLRLGEKSRWKRVNYALAADRIHANRKIIAQREHSIQETMMLRERMDQEVKSFAEAVGWLYKLWGRLGGCASLWQVMRRNNLSVPLQIPSIPRLLWTQLLGKDYKLVQ